MKRILSFIVILLLMFSISGNKSFDFAYAEEKSSITISSTQNEVCPGEDYVFNICFHSKYDSSNWKTVRTLIESSSFQHMTLKNWSTDIGVKYTDLMGKGDKTYFLDNNRYSIDIIIDEQYSTSNDINVTLTFTMDDDISLGEVQIIPVISKSIKLMIYDGDTPFENIETTTYSISSKNPLTITVTNEHTNSDKVSSSTSATNDSKTTISQEPEAQKSNGTNFVIPFIIIIIILLVGGIIIFIFRKNKKNKRV